MSSGERCLTYTTFIRGVLSSLASTLRTIQGFYSTYFVGRILIMVRSQYKEIR